jgi:hypothetical protein
MAIMIMLRGVCASSEAPHASRHHAPARRVGRGDCRATAVQRRLVAHTPQTAAVPSDPTARCLPAPGPPVGPWGLPVTARPWAIKGPGRRQSQGTSSTHTQGLTEREQRTSQSSTKTAIQLHSPMDVGYYAPAARTT